MILIEIDYFESQIYYICFTCLWFLLFCNFYNTLFTQYSTHSFVLYFEECGNFNGRKWEELIRFFIGCFILQTLSSTFFAGNKNDQIEIFESLFQEMLVFRFIR